MSLIFHLKRQLKKLFWHPQLQENTRIFAHKIYSHLFSFLVECTKKVNGCRKNSKTFVFSFPMELNQCTNVGALVVYTPAKS